MQNTIDNTNLDTVVARGGSLASRVFDLYVATTGSANNDGSATSPFALPTQAFSKLRVIGNGVTTIHIADGSYVENSLLPSVGNEEYNSADNLGNNVVYIAGNIATPSNVKIIGNGVNTSVLTISSNKTTFVFDGIQVEHSGTGLARSGFTVSNSNLVFKNVDFANIDRGVRLLNNSTLTTLSTGNQRTWAFFGSASSISGVTMAVNCVWLDLANITISGIKGYGITVGSNCLYSRTGDTLASITNNKLEIDGDVTTGCQGGIYVATEGMAQLTRLTHVKNATSETSKTLRSGAIVLDKGGKLELSGSCIVKAEDCNTIIASSPQSSIREVGAYSSYIAIGTTPSILSISPGTQLAMSRIGNSTLPQFSNVTIGSGIAIYNTNPDTIVISSLLNFLSVTGGPFIVGETITGSASGATGIIELADSTSIHYKMSNGNTFILGETITGSNIGATSLLTNVTEYNLLTKNNIQAGDIISFTYDQAQFTNAFNTFTVASVDRSVITLDIADAPVTQSYGPGSNVYTVGKVVAEQATKESTVSFASDFDPYRVEHFQHIGMLPAGVVGYFTRSGALSSNAVPLYIPHVSEEIWDIQVQARVAAGAGQTDTYTVLVNGVATAAEVTLSGASQLYNGKKLDAPLSITCGQINTIYEVGGGGLLTDLLNRGFFTGTVDSTFGIIVATGTPDTFTWSEMNSITGAGIASGGATNITGGWQLLADGVYIRFTNTTGHTNGTNWNFACSKADVITLRATTGAGTVSEDVTVALGLIRKQTL